LFIVKSGHLTCPGDRESIAFGGSTGREAEGSNERSKEDDEAEKDRHDKGMKGGKKDWRGKEEESRRIFSLLPR
jgi:hypothetical protein